MIHSSGYDLLYTDSLESTVQVEKIIEHYEHYDRHERTLDDIHGYRLGVWLKNSWRCSSYFCFLLREGLALISFHFQTYRLEKPKVLLRYLKLLKRKGIL